MGRWLLVAPFLRSLFALALVLASLVPGSSVTAQTPPPPAIIVRCHGESVLPCFEPATGSISITGTNFFGRDCANVVFDLLELTREEPPVANLGRTTTCNGSFGVTFDLPTGIATEHNYRVRALNTIPVVGGADRAITPASAPLCVTRTGACDGGGGGTTLSGRAQCGLRGDFLPFARVDLFSGANLVATTTA